MARRAILTAAALGAVAAGVALARPPSPPPKVAGAALAPPPAWLEVGPIERWLAYSSYCWKTVCVDFLPPAMRPDVPTVAVPRGQAARLHFGFSPSSVVVSRIGGGSQRLRAARVVPWRPSPGLYAIAVKAEAGSASYLVRVRLR